MSAAEVLVVATASWKRKGLLSAKDLLPASADVFAADGCAADDDSDFLTASLAALLFVLLLVLRRMRAGERSQNDDVLLDISPRESMEEASILCIL